MNATRPIRPTIAKNDVSVIILPPMFFRSLNQIKSERHKQQHDPSSSGFSFWSTSDCLFFASEASSWAERNWGFCGLDFSRLVVIVVSFLRLTVQR